MSQLTQVNLSQELTRVRFSDSFTTTKMCLKSPCTSISASNAVLAVQGLLRHILQGDHAWWFSINSIQGRYGS